LAINIKAKLCMYNIYKIYYIGIRNYTYTSSLTVTFTFYNANNTKQRGDHGSVVARTNAAAGEVCMA